MGVALLRPNPDVIPALSRDPSRDQAATARWIVLSPIHSTHSRSLGLDPRATLPTAQVAKDPRVEPEGRQVLGEILCPLSILSPRLDAGAYSPPSHRMGGLQANSGGGSRVRLRRSHRFESGRKRVRDPHGLFQKPAPRGGFRLSFLFTQRRKPPRGSSTHDNRVAGGAFACPIDSATFPAMVRRAPSRGNLHVPYRSRQDHR